MHGFLIYLVPSLLYALLAVLLVVTRDAGSEIAAVWRRYAILVPFLFHGYVLYLFVFTAEGLNFGVGSSLSAIVWFSVGIYFAGSFFYNLKALQPMIAAVASGSVLLPGIFHTPHFLQNASLLAFRAHLLIGLLAYSLFAIAAIQAALMDFMERRLHKASVPLTGMPPLLTMETILFRVLTVGFVLLTLTLLTGVVFSEEIYHKPLQFNHKVIFGFISWGIFAVLLGGRHFYGWRGRIAVRSTMVGFVMLLLAYIGSKFVLEVILQR